jgi:hypothetical protein
MVIHNAPITDCSQYASRPGKPYAGAAKIVKARVLRQSVPFSVSSQARSAFSSAFGWPFVGAHDRQRFAVNREKVECLDRGLRRLFIADVYVGVPFFAAASAISWKRNVILAGAVLSEQLQQVVLCCITGIACYE